MPSNLRRARFARCFNIQTPPPVNLHVYFSPSHEPPGSAGVPPAPWNCSHYSTGPASREPKTGTRRRDASAPRNCVPVPRIRSGNSHPNQNTDTQPKMRQLICPVSFQYQRDRPAALPPRAGEFAIFEFPIEGNADGRPFQTQVGREILGGTGRNFGSSQIGTDQRAGICSIRQFGDIESQLEF